jgi:hypothetical protein
LENFSKIHTYIKDRFYLRIYSKSGLSGLCESCIVFHCSFYVSFCTQVYLFNMAQFNPATRCWPYLFKTSWCTCTWFFFIIFCWVSLTHNNAVMHVKMDAKIGKNTCTRSSFKCWNARSFWGALPPCSSHRALPGQTWGPVWPPGHLLWFLIHLLFKYKMKTLHVYHVNV